MWLRRVFNPEIYQGAGNKHSYFEGWYFKLINEKRDRVIAVIPGISVDRSGDKAIAFIQLIDSVNRDQHYFEFPFSSFYSADNRFLIKIGGNSFDRYGLHLNNADNLLFIRGDLSFKNVMPFPKTIFNPGIMGPYSFIPWMECYHGIVNIHHNINGNLIINGTTVNFDNGEGYIEKDWGTSFPDTWLWVQANHFNKQGTCFMFSIAKIPWLGRYFIGLISFVQHKGRHYRFATYNWSRVESLCLKSNRLKGVITGNGLKLEFSAFYKQGSVLRAPKNGAMNRLIEESISAEAEITLTDHSNNIIFNGSSMHAGMEIAGDIVNMLEYFI